MVFSGVLLTRVCCNDTFCSWIEIDFLLVFFLLYPPPTTPLPSFSEADSSWTDHCALFYSCRNVETLPNWRVSGWRGRPEKWQTKGIRFN